MNDTSLPGRLSIKDRTLNIIENGITFINIFINDLRGPKISRMFLIMSFFVIGS